LVGDSRELGSDSHEQSRIKAILRFASFASLAFAFRKFVATLNVGSVILGRRQTLATAVALSACLSAKQIYSSENLERVTAPSLSALRGRLKEDLKDEFIQAKTDREIGTQVRTLFYITRSRAKRTRATRTACILYRREVPVARILHDVVADGPRAYK
jgi:hypothetical protein